MDRRPNDVADAAGADAASSSMSWSIATSITVLPTSPSTATMGGPLTTTPRLSKTLRRRTEFFAFGVDKGELYGVRKRSSRDRRRCDARCARCARCQAPHRSDETGRVHDHRRDRCECVSVFTSLQDRFDVLTFLDEIRSGEAELRRQILRASAASGGDLDCQVPRRSSLGSGPR